MQCCVDSHVIALNKQQDANNKDKFGCNRNVYLFLLEIEVTVCTDNFTQDALRLLNLNLIPTQGNSRP